MAINELIAIAEDLRCEPLSIRFGERTIKLINVKYLDQQQDEPEIK